MAEQSRTPAALNVCGTVAFTSIRSLLSFDKPVKVLIAVEETHPTHQTPPFFSWQPNFSFPAVFRSRMVGMSSPKALTFVS